jgi:hypothetical protein
VSRQFTDGEIVAAIKALAAEGTALTRASVRKRLGGGGSTRISAILKEYNAGANKAPARSGPSAVRSPRSGPIQSGPNGPEATGSGPVTGPTIGPANAPANALDSALAAGAPPGPEGSVAHLESEIRVLKILLESERNARREDEARHGRTIEALQREIEIASSRGWSERGAVRPREARSKTSS